MGRGQNANGANGALSGRAPAPWGLPEPVDPDQFSEALSSLVELVKERDVPREEMLITEQLRSIDPEKDYDHERDLEFQIRLSISSEGEATWLVRERNALHPLLEIEMRYQGSDAAEAINATNQAIRGAEERGWLWRSQYESDNNLPAWINEETINEELTRARAMLEAQANRRDNPPAPQKLVYERKDLSGLPVYHPTELEGRDPKEYRYVQIDDVDELATVLVYEWPHMRDGMHEFAATEGPDRPKFAVGPEVFQAKFGAPPRIGATYAIRPSDPEALLAAADTRADNLDFFEPELIEIDQNPKSAEPTYTY